MSDKTVKELAEMVKIPLDRFFEQLKQAGVDAVSPDDLLNEEERIKLLDHLRQRHGKSNVKDDDSLPKKITLKRRKVSELKQATGPGAPAKTVNVEVRKKKTYIKRSETDLTEEQLEIERAKKALEEQKQQIEAEEQERKQHEQNIQAAIEEKKRVEHQVEEKQAAEDNQDSLSEAAEKQVEKPKEEVEEKQTKPETIDPEKAEISEKDETPVEASKEESKTEEELKAERLEAEKKARLEASIERNAAKVRKQAEAKKQQTLHKKKQAAKTSNPAFADKGKENSLFDSASKKRGLAPGRGQPMPSGAGKRNKGKKGKQKKIQLAAEQDAKHQFEKPQETIVRDVTIPETIIVSDLAQKMSVKVAEVIKQLMKLGIMSTINQSIDQETAVILVEEMGHKPIMQSDDDLEKEMLAEVVDPNSIDDRKTESRAPIVTIMGHVDHGKTSLLDYIRESRVAAGEAGGITQHIGAYQVKTDHGSVTFLDTPGHAAFTAMRARGAEVTDVVIVVVAADDGVMPQTKEAIEHARAAEVPLIVAINKMDKPEANPEKVMQEMATLNVVPEEWGGDVQFLKVSAKTGEGIDELIEALILQSEILELTAPFEGPASGFVIESRLDKGRGAVATVLVQKGQLEKGQIVLCGHEYGRIRAMFDENGIAAIKAGPSTPVEILGLSGTPDAGDEFLFAQNERAAKELAEHREDRKKSSKHAVQQASKLDEVFSRMSAGDISTLNLVIKTDVQGSLEALRESLVKLSNDEVTVKCVYGGVGGINEGDANLALASGAILIGFNVRADATARKLISEKEIDLHYYSIIYEAIDEVKRAISGMLAPEIHEKIVGLAEVRDVFRSPKLGAIAGCMVIDGIVKRNSPIRVLRENVVIYEGQLESLRRYKDDVNEVKMGMECGIGVKNYNDVKTGDQIEVFERVEVRREI